MHVSAGVKVAVKIVFCAVFVVVWFCTMFVPPGPLNSAAWVAAVPIDTLLVAYYVHRKYARRRFAGRFLPR